MQKEVVSNRAMIESLASCLQNILLQTVNELFGIINVTLHRLLQPECELYFEKSGPCLNKCLLYTGNMYRNIDDKKPP